MSSLTPDCLWRSTHFRITKVHKNQSKATFPNEMCTQTNAKGTQAKGTHAHIASHFVVKCGFSLAKRHKCKKHPNTIKSHICLMKCAQKQKQRERRPKARTHHIAFHWQMWHFIGETTQMQKAPKTNQKPHFPMKRAHKQKQRERRPKARTHRIAFHWQMWHFIGETTHMQKASKHNQKPHLPNEMCTKAKARQSTKDAKHSAQRKVHKARSTVHNAQCTKYKAQCATTMSTQPRIFHFRQPRYAYSCP